MDSGGKFLFDLENSKWHRSIWYSLCTAAPFPSTQTRSRRGVLFPIFLRRGGGCTQAIGPDYRMFGSLCNFNAASNDERGDNSLE